MECEVSGNKSATRGVHGSPGKQGDPGEEHGADEQGSQLSARDLRLLGKEGLDRLKEGDEEVNVSGRSGNSFMTF